MLNCSLSLSPSLPLAPKKAEFPQTPRLGCLVGLSISLSLFLSLSLSLSLACLLARRLGKGRQPSTLRAARRPVVHVLSEGENGG